MVFEHVRFRLFEGICESGFGRWMY